MKRVIAILFLLSLVPASALAQSGVTPAPVAAPDDTARLGMRLFNQSCRLCHTPPRAGGVPYGPVLSRDSLGGQDEALRTFVASGSPRMPGFKSTFRPEELSALVGYLKTLPPAPAPGPEPD